MKRTKGNRNEIDGKHIVGVYDEFLADGEGSSVHAARMAHLVPATGHQHCDEPPH
jgi:hypothetical protein